MLIINDLAWREPRKGWNPDNANYCETKFRPGMYHRRSVSSFRAVDSRSMSGALSRIWRGGASG